MADLLLSGSGWSSLLLWDEMDVLRWSKQMVFGLGMEETAGTSSAHGQSKPNTDTDLIQAYLGIQPSDYNRHVYPEAP